MRPIEFRGLRKDGKGWVYGHYCKHAVIDKHLIADIETSTWNEVDPSTVGQFIGVKGYEGDYENRHQNEVKLFEGDVVEAWSQGQKGRFVISFRNESNPSYILFPAWQHGKMWQISASDLGRPKGDYYDDLKRIGNKFDNPELIKP